MTPAIAEFSEQWEGRTIEDGLTLGRCLGKGADSLVFLTDFETRPAAIKILPIEADHADTQLHQWTAASMLSHPNLLRIFKTGRCQIDDIELLYIVMERSDESLSEVLPQRALTVVEARQMLEPTVSALAYLHGRGMVHTHLKPTNIMAVDECVKLSSDTVRSAAESLISGPAGPYDAPERTPSTAGDVWSLGVILVEALTQRVQRTAPSNLSEPFGTIASHCLQPSPKDRWTIAQIETGLAPPAADAQRKSRFGIPMGVRILLGLIVVLVLGVILKSKQSPAPESQPAVETAHASEAPKVAAEKTRQSEPEKKPEPAGPVTQTVPQETAPQAAPQPPPQMPTQIGDQPMPEVLPQARNSIHGKVTVFVRVDTDASGVVTNATITPPRTSKYFSAQALKAVRQWKFPPSDASQKWQVRFEFLSSGTKVYPQRL